MRKIRKGDKVQMMSGKEKGLTGIVLDVLVKKPAKGKVSKREELMVLVQGLNMKKRHVKPKPQAEKPGEIVNKEAPVHVCKVRVIDANGKPSRLGIRTLEDGTKVRYFKSTGEVVNG